MQPFKGMPIQMTFLCNHSHKGKLLHCKYPPPLFKGMSIQMTYMFTRLRRGNDGTVSTKPTWSLV
jgi:hypothetical protein